MCAALNSIFPAVDKERAWKILDGVLPIAKAHGCSPARVALAWLLTRPAVTSVILGAKRWDQMQDNLQAVDLKLTDRYATQFACHWDTTGQPVLPGRHELWRSLGWGSSVADSEAILARSLDLGGNFIDTANIYTKGHSEKIIGDFFAQRKGKRDRIVIATKFFCNLFAGDPNGGGASRKAIVAPCDESLRRLQTDTSTYTTCTTGTGLLQ